jgi:hypothetical protein
MANKKITEATNVYPTGTDKLPIGRVASVTAYNVTVSDLRHGVIDVHDYGAVGDGTTDDAAAINLALAATVTPAYGATRAGKIKVKFHPNKVYRITSPLNVCEKQDVILDFQESVLLGETDGAAMIEIIGSQYVNIRNVNLYGSDTNPPGVGIFTSRSNTVHGTNSSVIGYDNVRFGGNFTHAPIYVVESESNFFHNCTTSGLSGTMTTCVLLCRANELALTPVHATLGDHGYGLFNINFDRCQITNSGGVRAIHIHDGSGDVHIHDSYLYSTTVPTIEVEGGAYVYLDHVGCEGTPNYTVYLNYDAGAVENIYRLYMNSFGFGSPTSHTLYADDDTILRNSYIKASFPGMSGGAAKPVRLWMAENCDFTGLADYRSGVFDILFDGATGYSNYCKYRLMQDDTLTFSGGALSNGNTIENMATVSSEYLQVPGLKFGADCSILKCITGTKTWDVGSLADGATASEYVSILGMSADGTWVCLASLDSLDEYGWQISATPDDSGAVRVNVTNHSGGVIDPPSGTLRVVAMKVA